MKKTAFTCSRCGTLNLPSAREHWKGWAPCNGCGSIECVSSRGADRTEGHLYHAFSAKSGLSVTMILELQKRGIFPRDLAKSNSTHESIAYALNLALRSEEILRGALARIPIKRRENLLYAIPADGLLTRWQREILQRYIGEYEVELQIPAVTVPGLKRPKRFGSTLTSIPAMIRHIEQKFGIPASTSRPWIRRLKKRAYNRVHGNAKEGADNG